MARNVRTTTARTEKPADDSGDPTVQAILAAKREAEDGRRQRIWRSQMNRDAYNGIQDWTHKVEGQSTEFIPKTSETVDQFAAVFKRALTQFGDWFSVQVGKESPLSATTVRNILKYYLDRLPDGDSTTNFATRISDAAKNGLLECLMVFKVHGYRMPELAYRVVKDGNTEKVKAVDAKPFRLSIDLVPPEDYKPDPTGRKLYKIHTVERDWHQALAMAEAGVYDESVIAHIKEDFRRAEEEKRIQGIHEAAFRRRIVIDEYWGTLLNQQGEVSHETVLCALANDKYIIRKPEPYPNWYGEDPFVAIPMIRVPHTVWHRAVMDEVVSLNLALNELFNLTLDGGIASVWGVRQLRMDLLDDPTQVSNGIPQNKTLVLREGVPEGTKVLEQVTTGLVPPDAMAMYNVLEKEMVAASKQNVIGLGQLPDKVVKATEVASLDQSQSAMMDGIVSDVEQGITQVLRKAWLTLLQNADFLVESDLAELMTHKELITLANMSDAERFAKLANGAKFRVFGLSATLAKARDFQKIMALLQVSAQNPVLQRAMMVKFDGERILEKIIRVLNLNPEDLERDPDKDPSQEIRTVMGMMMAQNGQMPGQGPAASNQSAGMTGEPGMPSEINQTAQPSQVQ